jgi:hypothetical protein
VAVSSPEAGAHEVRDPTVAYPLDVIEQPAPRRKRRWLRRTVLVTIVVLLLGGWWIETRFPRGQCSGNLFSRERHCLVGP